MCNKDNENLEKTDNLYFKDNDDCVYSMVLSGLSFCIWTNTLCRNIPYEHCAKLCNDPELNGESDE